MSDSPLPAPSKDRCWTRARAGVAAARTMIARGAVHAGDIASRLYFAVLCAVLAEALRQGREPAPKADGQRRWEQRDVWGAARLLRLNETVRDEIGELADLLRGPRTAADYGIGRVSFATVDELARLTDRVDGLLDSLGVPESSHA